MNVEEIGRILLYFITFGLSFYCLSGIDFAKVMLPKNDRPAKAQFLLILLSMALGYLVAQFILAIMYHL